LVLEQELPLLELVQELQQPELEQVPLRLERVLLQLVLELEQELVLVLELEQPFEEVDHHS
jgi:hypothetical protein